MNHEQRILDILIKEDYYENLRVLEDGTIVGTGRLLFTTALYMGLNETGWEKRYCYKNLEALHKSLQSLKTIDDEPTGWIAKRGS